MMKDIHIKLPPASGFQYRKKKTPCCLDSDMCPLLPEWPLGPHWQDPFSDFTFPHPEFCSSALNVKIKVNRNVFIEILAKTHVAFASAFTRHVSRSRLIPSIDSQYFICNTCPRTCSCMYNIDEMWLTRRAECASPSHLASFSFFLS